MGDIASHAGSILRTNKFVLSILGISKNANKPLIFHPKAYEASRKLVVEGRTRER